MKTKKIMLFVCGLALCFTACDTLNSFLNTNGNSSSSASGNSNSSNYGTSGGSATSLEAAVLAELNFARTKPKEYVAARLQPYAASGSTALKECISEMNKMSPVAALKEGAGLTKTAREWVAVQGPTGETGHGSGSNSFTTRIQKYSKWTQVAENISYGHNDAEKIVRQLLEDNGVASRGHRKNILNQAYTHVGIACGEHKVFRYMCVQDFAANYSAK